MRPLVLLLFLLPVILCLYEDEAGTIDWHQSYIGHVTQAIYHPKQAQRRFIYAGTEKGVVAALKSVTGDLVWRQVLPEGESINALALYQRILVTISDETKVRCWLASDGSLLWDTDSYSRPESALTSDLLRSVENEKKIEEIRSSKQKTKSFPGQDIAFLPRGDSDVGSSTTTKYEAKSPDDDKADPIVIVLTQNRVSAYDGAIGTELWQWSDKGKQIHKVYVLGNDIYLVGITGSQLNVVVLNKRGDVTKQEQVQLTSPQASSLLFLPQGTIVHLDAKAKSLSLVSVVSPRLITYPLPKGVDGSVLSLADIGLAGFFVVATPGKKHVISIAEPQNPTIVLTASDRDELLGYGGETATLAQLEFQQEERSVTAKIFSLNKNQAQFEQNLATSSALPSSVRGVKGWLTAFRGSNGKDMVYRILLSGSDHSLFTLQASGKGWQREEALADILQVEYASLPHSSVFLEKTSFPPLSARLGLVARSVRSGIRHFQQFIQSLQAGKAGKDSTSDEIMVEDDFGFRKLILAMTKAGKLFALNTENGEAVWQSTVFSSLENGGNEAFSRFLLIESHTLLIITNKIENGLTQSVVRIIDALNGENKLPSLYNDNRPFITFEDQIQHVILVPWLDSAENPILLFVLPNKVISYPNTKEAHETISKHLASLFYYQVSVTKDEIVGYGFTEDAKGGFHSTLLWRIAFPEAEHISSLSAQDPTEVVHSAIRVIGDGSTVRYKYLNKNLLVVGTTRTATNTASRPVHPSIKNPDPAVYVYFIDAVSGRILDRIFHRDSTGPVYLLQSENVVYYHYWNVKLQRYEMSVVELYLPEEIHEFSSFSSPNPIPLQQTYYFKTGIKELAVSQTRKGITEKDIIFGLNSDQLLVLPKRLLDPRRPIEAPTPQETAEGLIPYESELPADSLAIISYNITINHLAGIKASSSGLESTSLIFAWGLDLFFTRVTPSGTFDLLSDDFNYVFLIGTVSFTIVLQFVAQRWSAKKQLQMDWA